jgi:hypothetical protein
VRIGAATAATAKPRTKSRRDAGATTARRTQARRWLYSLVGRMMTKSNSSRWRRFARTRSEFEAGLEGDHAGRAVAAEAYA